MATRVIPLIYSLGPWESSDFLPENVIFWRETEKFLPLNVNAVAIDNCDVAFFLFLRCLFFALFDSLFVSSSFLVCAASSF